MIDPTGFNELEAVPLRAAALQQERLADRRLAQEVRRVLLAGGRAIPAGRDQGHAGDRRRGEHRHAHGGAVEDGGFVLAFEPQRISFQTLCANLALNHCRNVRAFNAALGRENGHILVPSRDPTKINNFGGVPLAGATEGESVELMKLDRIQFNKCDFIKVDIEGMEAEFLEGAKETIAQAPADPVPGGGRGAED
jgi:FkbM family methyltransferase